MGPSGLRSLPAPFTITVKNRVEDTHENPNWTIGNKRYQEEEVVRLAPIETGELTGSEPLTISFTDADAWDDQPASEWLTLANNVFTGTAPDEGETSTVSLTATNTDIDGNTHTDIAVITITVVDDQGPPVWDIEDQEVNENRVLTIDPLTTGELTGARPIVITLTNPLPANLQWLDLDDNVLTGTAPQVTADSRRGPVQLTAANTDAQGNIRSVNTSFYVTIKNVRAPHDEPTWTVSDRTVKEGAGVTIDPIGSGLVGGSTPLTISVSPSPPAPTGYVLPDWATDGGTTLSFTQTNILTGTAPDKLEENTDYTIWLRATNTDSEGVDHHADASFTITVEVEDEPPEIVCAAPSIRGIRRVNREIYIAPNGGNSGVLDIRESIYPDNEGCVPQVRNDDDYAMPDFITSANFGEGLIPYRMPTGHEEIRDTVGLHPIWIIAENNAGVDRANFNIVVKFEYTNPPVIGDIPDIVLDGPCNPESPPTFQTNLAQYLTSTHTVDSPTWEKVTAGYDDDPSRADWWTVDEQGNLNITAPSIQRNTDYRFGVTATNDDGDDTEYFNLTVIYVPEAPRWNPIGNHPDEEGVWVIPERSVIGFNIREFVTTTVTDIDLLLSVTKVDSDAPELFLEALDNPPQSNIGRIIGANNAGGNADVKGTSDVLPTGQPPSVITINAPEVPADKDYTVAVRATNVGLVTTPECPDNSADTTFTLRIENRFVRVPAPEWIEIPLQTTISGESISLSLGRFARNSPTSYEIVSMLRIRGPNPGPIALEASNTGVVTRVGGAVAPPITSTVLYRVVIRAINSGGFSDCPF